MGYILLGHGILSVDAALTPPDMEWVAIPHGTSIQFYADSFQGLCYRSRHLEAWEEIQPHLLPLTPNRVTYNLSLRSDPSWERDLANNPRFGGHQLIRPGIGDIPDPVRLCTGTRATCPTSPDQTSSGRTHTCDGILGRPDFQGQELFWLACTEVEGADETVVAAALAGRPTAVILGDDPDLFRTLDETGLRAVDEHNEAELRYSPHGAEQPYALAGPVFLMGYHHAPEHVDYVCAHDGMLAGSLLVLNSGDTRVVVFEELPEDAYDVVDTAVQRFAAGAEVWVSEFDTARRYYADRCVPTDGDESCTSGDETGSDRADGDEDLLGAFHVPPCSVQ
ncbi:hypothetical protein [Streptomyces sp. NPDC001594]|uniref:hypothetical protein n=1 Tax=Streptomyces sp. NPDC001594 TaxID=3364590 RepID=UPI003693DA6C